jgi:hypothetical protein
MLRIALDSGEGLPRRSARLNTRASTPAMAPARRTSDSLGRAATDAPATELLDTPDPSVALIGHLSFLLPSSGGSLR